jgi:sugar O-acyltransferase (sialic acid O-acetyltransferase NeuD family)
MATAQRLLIVGAGGMAREALWLAREARAPFEVIGFLDDAPERRGQAFDGVPILGPVEDWTRFDALVVVAIGTPRTRKAVAGRLGGARFATLVHCGAAIGHNVEIGEGSMVAAGAIATCDIRVGRHALVNAGAIVMHDSRLGDYATLAPGVVIPGAVDCGAGCEVALGASIRHGCVLGAGSMVGMGAVVTRDVAPNMLVYGVPAAPVRALEPFEGGTR